MNTHVEEKIQPKFLKAESGKAEHIFNDTFLNYDRTVRRRHGQLWNDNEKTQLVSLFRKGNSLASICVALQRPASGVLSKLVQLGCLKVDAMGVHRYAYDVELPEPVGASLEEVKPEDLVGLLKLRGEHDPCNGPDFDDIERRIMGDIKVGAMDLRGHQLDAYRYLLADVYGTGRGTVSGIVKPQSLTHKEITMSKAAPNIEIKTFIRGVEASSCTDRQLLDLVAELEAEIKYLNGIAAPSSKRAAAVDALKEDIGAIVKYLDDRK